MVRNIFGKFQAFRWRLYTRFTGQPRYGPADYICDVCGGRAEVDRCLECGRHLVEHKDSQYANRR